MHCYEYLAMHLHLKSQMKCQFPDRHFNELEIEELLCALNVKGLDQLLLIQQQQKHPKTKSKVNLPGSIHRPASGQVSLGMDK